MLETSEETEEIKLEELVRRAQMVTRSQDPLPETCRHNADIAHRSGKARCISALMNSALYKISIGWRSTDVILHKER